MKKPELLAPAGDYSRMMYAIQYGADAVYLGGEEFSLRTAVKNFSATELEKAVEFAHSKQKKVYIACNSVPRNDEINRLPSYLEFLNEIKVDAVICSDFGVFSLAKKHCPNVEIHISTQANVCNFLTARMWHELGASRVVLARELSLDEISAIHRECPELELEAFVHGAMCVSHSGRCLLSNYMTARDSNRGSCAQPCRWKYTLCEEKREGQYFPVYETDTGTFILNSKDMCMIEHIPDLLTAGIDSFKIEGRVKTEYYVACITQAYRRAIDSCFEDLSYYSDHVGEFYEEVCKVSHREYYPGFFYGDQAENGQNYKESSYIRDYEVVAEVKSYDALMGCILVSQKNKFAVGDVCEILEAGKDPYTFTIDKIYDEHNNEILTAPHPGMLVKVKIDKYIGSMSFVRRKKGVNW
ncbi:MAG: peptidase U32 [Clostridiales bacterium]|nr:MAG: peptidase U32 [Clostridiales bacterium]